MNGRYLLDTNIVIAFLTGDSTATNRLDDSDEVFVSATVIGELLYGAFNSANVDQNIKRIEGFLHDAAAVPCDSTTARVYGEIKTLLHRKGRPIPDNDIWIAATARQYALSLVTRDEHFAEVDDLALVRW